MKDDGDNEVGVWNAEAKEIGIKKGLCEVDKREYCYNR